MIKVQTPAKINLTLEILGKRKDGFHNIQSIMQAVNVFDYLSIEVSNESPLNVIELSGNIDLIPYNEDNLVYKAAQLFLEAASIKNKRISIYIEKNIPVAAGLAGGSSNAAGTLVGLNELFDKPLSIEKIHDLASKLGSDLNFCIDGGTQIATSRGEVLKKLDTPELDLIIVKPKDLGVSAAFAYKKYVQMKNKPEIKNTDKMINIICCPELDSGSHNLAIPDQVRNDASKKIAELLNNDLEIAIINDYPQINEIKQKLIDAGCINALMSGSGPTVFGITNKEVNVDFGYELEVFKVKSIGFGIRVIS